MSQRRPQWLYCGCVCMYIPDMMMSTAIMTETEMMMSVLSWEEEDMGGPLGRPNGGTPGGMPGGGPGTTMAGLLLSIN